MNKKENQTEWDEFTDGLDDALMSILKPIKQKVKKSIPKGWVVLGIVIIASIGLILNNEPIPTDDFVDETNTFTSSTYQYSPEIEPIGYAPLYYEFMNFTFLEDHGFDCEDYFCRLDEVAESYLWKITFKINSSLSGLTFVPQPQNEIITLEMYNQFIYESRWFDFHVMRPYKTNCFLNISISYVCLNSTN